MAVGQERGFYDYASQSPELIPADQMFKEQESTFPPLREKLIQTSFRNWKEHLQELLAFANMIRARSRTFLEERVQVHSGRYFWRIKSVVSPTQFTLESMTPEPVKLEWVRNRSLMEMGEEIETGPVSLLRDFCWCLRIATSASDPLVISEHAFVAVGPMPLKKDVQLHEDTFLYFPLCWRACLIGSRFPFRVETDYFT